MSMIDKMTDDQISDLQKKALCVELMQIYNAERNILADMLKGQGITVSADELRFLARSRLSVGPVDHPIEGEV